MAQLNQPQKKECRVLTREFEPEPHLGGKTKTVMSQAAKWDRNRVYHRFPKPKTASLKKSLIKGSKVSCGLAGLNLSAHDLVNEIFRFWFIVYPRRQHRFDADFKNVTLAAIRGLDWGVWRLGGCLALWLQHVSNRLCQQSPRDKNVQTFRLPPKLSSLKESERVTVKTDPHRKDKVNQGVEFVRRSLGSARGLAEIVGKKKQE